MSSRLESNMGESEERLSELLKAVEGNDAGDEHLSELKGYTDGFLLWGVELYKENQWAEAQEVQQHAVIIFRRLYTANPDVYRVNLARSLNNLSSYLSMLQHHSEARDTILEALEHRRILFAANPDVYRVDLANSLHNLSSYLDNLKCHSEAQDTIVEALKHWQILFAANPDVYRADLAVSLHNLSSYLDNLKRHSEARDTIVEALEHRRILFAANPDVYRPDLANSLHNLSTYLDALKRHSDARDTILEALEHWQTPFAANPDVYRVDLTNSLQNLSSYLNMLKRHSKARDTILEALEHWKTLFAANPDAYRPYLADCLNNLAGSLNALKRHPEARDTILKVLEHRRILFAANPDVYRPDLANCLNISSCLNMLKHHSEARDTILEALGHYRILFTANPDVYRPDLSNCLNNLAGTLNALKHHSDARNTILEALEHWQTLFATNPDIYRANLARSLNSLSSYLDALKRHSDARNTIFEALKHWRTLFDAHPAIYRADLTASLILQFQYLHNLELHLEASHAERESLILLDRTHDIKAPSSQARIDSGSFGTHYEQLVVKMINGVPATLLSDFKFDKKPIRQLFREMTVSFRVGQHPNLVPYLGYIMDKDSNRIGLLLPLFSGGNILQYIEKNPREDRRKLCRDIASGVRELHTLPDPIAHGDLKPENVVIDADGQATLCDFGIAHIKLAADLEDSNSPPADGKPSPKVSRHTGLTDSEFNGTLRYCARELMEIDDACPTLPADVWAFACTVAYILTGVIPFSQFMEPGSKGNAKVLDALEDSVPPYAIDSITKDYPDFAILAECWDPEPSNRPTMVDVCKRMGWEDEPNVVERDQVDMKEGKS